MENKTLTVQDLLNQLQAISDKSLPVYTYDMDKDKLYLVKDVDTDQATWVDIMF